MTDKQKAVVAELMNRLPFVTWDRCVEYEHGVNADDFSAFGWIQRDDGNYDYVELIWPSLDDPEVCGYSTSSAAYSEKIADILFGGHEGHQSCERVEHVFGDLVERRVVLA